MEIYHVIRYNFIDEIFIIKEKLPEYWHRSALINHCYAISKFCTLLKNYKFFLN